MRCHYIQSYALKIVSTPGQLQFSSTSISMKTTTKYINMNKKITQYVSKKKIGGKKPEGLNIVSILELAYEKILLTGSIWSHELMHGWL